MKTLNIITIIFAFVLLITSNQTVFAHDSFKGNRAWNNGDYETAYKRWQRMADKGDAGAQYNLGVMHLNGQGLPQNFREARRWFLSAATKGFAPAMLSLGSMYALGQGVIQDRQYAHMWYNIAAAAGNPQAATQRAMLENHMSSSAIIKAQELARGCVAKGYQGC